MTHWGQNWRRNYWKIGQPLVPLISPITRYHESQQMKLFSLRCSSFKQPGDCQEGFGQNCRFWSHCQDLFEWKWVCGSHLRSQMIRFFICDYGCWERVSLLERPKICPSKKMETKFVWVKMETIVWREPAEVWSHNCGATVPTVSWRETLKGGGAAAQIYLWHSGHEANFYLALIDLNISQP